MKYKTMFEKSNAFDISRFEVDKNAEVAHQNMMKQIIDEGWGDKRYLGVWGKIIKSSQIHPEALQKLIIKGKASKFNTRGWVRNRLQENSWRSWTADKT